MKKDSLKKIYITYRLVVFPVVTAFSCLILIIFVIYPQASSLIGNYQTEEKFQDDFRNIKAKAQILESLDKTDLNRKLELALNVYPTDYDYADVIGVLQGVIGKLGFDLVSLQVGGTAKQAKDSSAYQIKVEITGPKVMLQDLIKNIESYPRIMKVNGINVSSTGGSDDVSVNLDIMVYYQPLPKTAGNEDSSLPAISEEEEAILTALARSQPATAQVTRDTQVPTGKINPFE